MQYPGYAQPKINPDETHFFPVEENPYLPFSFPNQFDPTVIDLAVSLAISVVNEFKIPGEHVLPHSSISYNKTDPGPFMFWDDFAQKGVGVLAKEERVLENQMDISIKHIQSMLSKWGYPNVPQTSEFDEGTKKVLQAHYMHHLPSDIKWDKFVKQTKGTVFDEIKSWSDFDADKEALVINLENLNAGQYKYKPLFSLKG